MEAGFGLTQETRQRVCWLCEAACPVLQNRVFALPLPSPGERFTAEGAAVAGTGPAETRRSSCERRSSRDAEAKRRGATAPHKQGGCCALALLERQWAGPSAAASAPRGLPPGSGAGPRLPPALPGGGGGAAARPSPPLPSPRLRWRRRGPPPSAAGAGRAEPRAPSRLSPQRLRAAGHRPPLGRLGAALGWRRPAGATRMAGAAPGPPVKVLAAQLRGAVRGDGGTWLLSRAEAGRAPLRLQAVWMQGTVLEVERGGARGGSARLQDDSGPFTVLGVEEVPKGRPCLSAGTGGWGWR